VVETVPVQGTVKQLTKAHFEEVYQKLHEAKRQLECRPQSA
jgi:hypothetical protein